MKDLKNKQRERARFSIETVSYTLADQTLAEIVAQNYPLKAEDPFSTAVTFYDTFDWRLYNNAMLLTQSDKELVLRCLPTGAPQEKLPATTAPTFIHDLPDSHLRRRIGQLVAERRFFPVGEAHIQTITYRVLNSDEKTVAHLHESKIWLDSDASAILLESCVTLLPVRGYNGHFRRLSKAFTAAGLSPCSWQTMFERIVTASGRQPGSYSARPDYRLRPGMPAEAATRLILHQTQMVMRANEEGIKADWDIEFLHDYRKAVRQTRSALSQIPGVFPPAITAHFKEAFAQLGDLTNQARDLDVYLLAEPAYRSMLPTVMQEQITPLFDYLRMQRQQAMCDVRNALNSPTYADLMTTWAAFLDEPATEITAVANATRPVEEIARQRISKRYQQVIKDGRHIVAHTPDEVWHQLRIDCKKLRYVMEFFASLFPKKEMGRLIGQLKALQEDLGAFNDLSVQQDYLLQVAERLPVSTAQNGKVLVAIGVLVEKLSREQQALKPQLMQDFAIFAAAPNQILFRKLFQTNKRKSKS
jgi:CHAD domain-containing protein